MGNIKAKDVPQPPIEFAVCVQPVVSRNSLSKHAMQPLIQYVPDAKKIVFLDFMKLALASRMKAVIATVGSVAQSAP